MNKCNRFAILSCASVFAFGLSPAHSNGINPPRSQRGIIMTASCKDASGKQLHLVMRAQVKERGASSRSSFLTLHVDDVDQQLALQDIKVLAFGSGALDRDGFAKATLTRRSGAAPESAAIRVGSGNSKVMLVGFTNTAASVEVDLFKCKRIDFTQQADETPRGPPRATAE